MNYFKKFLITPGSQVRLNDFDPQYTGKRQKKKTAIQEIGKLLQRMDKMQYCLFAEHKRSLLIVIQALDAGGKDGVIRHIISSLNPQGCRVVSFKVPSPEELAHDFLWRIESQTPKPGEVVVFNRSQYEDVLIVRVHNLVPKEIWSNRYGLINEFEQKLAANGTHIIKFFLHISKKEQLKRFKERLTDSKRSWKISDSDYTEREYWDDYEAAYEDVLSKCSTNDAPWFVIPSDHKWFRDLAISQIIVEKMEKLGIRAPEPTVNLDDIRRKYHEAAEKKKKYL
jgi:PPK2 family polyphosphate:nucleotide phosphotransferase